VRRLLVAIASVLVFTAWAPGGSRAQTGVVYTFANAAVQPGGGTYAFDVQASAVTAGTTLGDLLVYVNYDAASFGTSVVAGSRVTVTAEGPASDPARYAIHMNDHAPGRLAIAIEYLDPGNPANGAALPQAPVTVARVAFNLVAAGTTPALTYESALMSGQQYQANPALSFASVAVSSSNVLNPGGSTPTWSVNPTAFQSTATLVGALTLDATASTNPADVVAAFVGSEVRGLATSIAVGGQRLFFLTIHGTGNGDTVTFKAYDAAQDRVVDLDETVTFAADANFGTVAAPFALSGQASGQVLNLTSGWNLVSLAVTPPNSDPAVVFAGAAGSIEYVTGFAGGATFFDPNGLAFLNTLTALEGGRGYWVKASAPVSVTVAGPTLPQNQPLSLADGWNLIGYWRTQAKAPADVFSGLITSNRLQYVTSFSGGSTFYDPNGLPFLNTLATMQPGQGYWVKVSGAEANFTFKTNQVRPTNRYMFMGGTLQGDGVRKTVQVVTRDGRVVGEGTVSAVGQVPAIAVYGDDRTTTETDGAVDGEDLFLRFDGRTMPTGLVFEADMTLHPISVATDVDAPEVPTRFAVASGYPNPFSRAMTVPIDVPQAGPVRMLLFDAQGRRVATVLDDVLAPGRHTVRVRATGLPSGTYFLQTSLGQTSFTQSIQIIR